jgi:hypothetical protein
VVKSRVLLIGAATVGLFLAGCSGAGTKDAAGPSGSGGTGGISSGQVKPTPTPLIVNGIQVKVGGPSNSEVSDLQKNKTVTLSMDQKEYHQGDKIRTVIENHTQTVLQFGASAGVEVLMDGVWHRAEFTNMVITAILFNVEPGSSYSGDLNLPDFLAPGTYRLVKAVSTDGDASNDELRLIGDAFQVTSKL